jgi:hypothetical protein
MVDALVDAIFACLCSGRHGPADRTEIVPAFVPMAGAPMEVTQQQ